MDNPEDHKKDNLIWIDLEMTGLDPEGDRIIEIATIITNNDLEILAEGPVLAVHQSDSLLDNMDEWCVLHHGQSGLTERVRNSHVTDADAEAQTIEFLREWVYKGQSPMCGNSVCQDRRFLVRYMPELESWFHYRAIDVSSVKELAKRWKPTILPGFSKQNNHLALDDIRESVAELRYYREHFLKS